MHDMLHNHLTVGEKQAYDRFSARAALARHFLLWSAVLSVALYFISTFNIAQFFFGIAAFSLPIMIFNIREARALRQLAEKRSRAIMQVKEGKEIKA